MLFNPVNKNKTQNAQTICYRASYKKASPVIDL